MGAAQAQSLLQSSQPAPQTGSGLGSSPSSSIGLTSTGSAFITPARPAGPVAPRALSALSGAAVMPTIQVSVASVVNDDAISTYELSQRMLWMAVTSGLQPTPDTIPQLQADALDALIDEKLEIQELKHQAHERKKPENAFFSEEADVDGYLEQVAQGNKMSRSQFMEALTSRGLTEATIRQQIKIQLSWRDWIQHYYGARIKVGDDQIKQALDRVAAASTKPSYLTSQIFIDAAHSGGMDNAVASATQRMQQLQQGARFEAIARQFSALPTAANGGDAGWLNAGEFPKEVEAVLPEMKADQIKAVPTKDGVYLVMLREKKIGGASAMMTLKQVALPLPADAPANVVQAAQARLVGLRNRLNGCSNIDQLAKNAGLEVDELGESDPATLAPAFRDAITALQAGQVANPIRSPQGLHLVAVCRRRASGAEIPTLEEMTNKLTVEQLTMIQRRELRDLRNAATITQPR